MDAPRIREFVEQLPCSTQVESLADLAVQFSRSGPSGQVVILDAFQRPRGVAHAQRWLLYLSKIQQNVTPVGDLLHVQASSADCLRSFDAASYEIEQQPSSRAQPSFLSVNPSLDSNRLPRFHVSSSEPSTESQVSYDSHTLIQEFIHSIYAETGQMLLEPVAIALDQWTLDEFQANLQRHLNFMNDAQQTESHSSSSSQAADCHPSLACKGDSVTAHPHLLQWVVVDERDRYLGIVNVSQIWQALMPPVLVPSDVGQSSSDRGGSIYPDLGGQSLGLPPQTEKSLLSNTLEGLPLPLMVQSTEGCVVAHNQTWRQQLSELADAENLWQQVTQVLDGSFEADQGEDTTQLYPSGAIAAPAIRSGHGMSSCMCICTLTNGQERVWQFHKIPMPPMIPGQSTLEPAPSSPSVSSSLTAFRLASLTASLAPISPQPISATPAASPLWLIYAQDITEQRQVLKELAARNADLAQTSRLKDEFLACITHELKTPLTSVLGLSGLMKDQTIGSLNNRQLRYMQLIHNSGRRLVLIVNDILDLTRIETGQLQLNSAPTEIYTVCKHAYEEAEQAHLYAENNDIIRPDKTGADLESSLNLPTFHVEIQPGLKQVVADELRLRQILSHLLSNALKFTPVDGEIGLQVSLWENWISFTVWDTGIGIPAEKQHLIFQKFQQLENPMTRQFEGTGLGLVLAQKLAQLHGGDMTFTSTEGKGSQFTLLLPPRPLQIQDAWTMNTASMLYPASGAAMGEMPSGAAGEEKSQSPVNRLIVIVEADRQLIDHLLKHVTAQGYRAVIARSGTEAIGKVRRLQPRMVLLNSVLPLLSGWDVLTLLKTDALTRHIPIVVMASPLESTKATENQADGVLTHPIHASEIQRVINRVGKQQETEPILDSLTLLYLNPEPASPTAVELAESQIPQGSPPAAAIALNTQTLNSLLHPYRCRVIEVDDLDQAELLSRVWKPDVILLGEPFPQPDVAIADLSQRLGLAELPLVTLSRTTTQIANRLPGLKVFPCLDPMQVPLESDPAYGFGLSSLLQVIQIATGIQWVPHIVVTHSDYLLHPDIAQVYDPDYGHHHGHRPIIDSRLQASSQYFQTAGLRSSVMTSFSDITQCVAQKNVDVLLLCCSDAESSLDSLLLKLEMLDQLDPLMPILIWLEGKATAYTSASASTSASANINQSKDAAFNPQSQGQFPRRADADAASGQSYGKSYGSYGQSYSYVEATLKAWVSHVLPAAIAIDEVFAAVNAAIARRIHTRS